MKKFYTTKRWNVRGEKTFSENMDVLCEGIMKAIELAVPHEWSEFNSFSGRMIYKKQPLRDAQKSSVKKFLTEVFEPKSPTPPVEHEKEDVK